jgi:hypothetical protein
MRPLVALGLTWLAMFSVLQLAQNLFGYDRDGFRALVLSPARRRDILLGKNVSLAPIGLGVGLMALMAMQMLIPLGLAHFLASLVQMGSLYLVLCMTGNVVSILAPLATSAGALRRSRPSATTIALQFLFALAIPLVTVPLLIPYGLELLCDYLGWLPYVPVYLLLALMTLGLAIYIYSRVLTLEGRLLERRQLTILETVTSGRD